MTETYEKIPDRIYPAEVLHCLASSKLAQKMYILIELYINADCLQK